MKKIKIITDSTCDLSQTLIEKHAIEVLPLYVNFGDESFKDGVDLSTEEMYEIVKERKTLPKTAAASPGDFESVFKRYLDEGYQVLYCGIGSKFSATLQSAMLAKQMLETEDVALVDSMNLSSGSGLLLLKAAKFRDEGDSLEVIKEKLDALVPKVRSQFVIDTLDYLYKGGRLNALSAMMGTVLKIKPIIRVVDGAMAVGKKARGNTKAGAKILVKEVIALEGEIDEDFMMITHSLAHDTAKYIKEQFSEAPPVTNLYETEAGCVISSHCGKGTIGILYIMK